MRLSKEQMEKIQSMGISPDQVEACLDSDGNIDQSKLSQLNEFSELSEDELGAVSGGCNSSPVYCDHKCFFCGQTIGYDDYSWNVTPTGGAKYFHTACNQH